MQLPLEVMRTNAGRIAEIGKTRNISSGGVLFSSKTKMAIGGPIEYLISLDIHGSNPVQLHCVGKVLRQEQESESAYAIAATLERYQFRRPNPVNTPKNGS